MKKEGEMKENPAPFGGVHVFRVRPCKFLAEMK
jgi:hypothetical protein